MTDHEGAGQSRPLMREVTVVIRTMLDDDMLIDAVNAHGQLLFVRREASEAAPSPDPRTLVHRALDAHRSSGCASEREFGSPGCQCYANMQRALAEAAPSPDHCPACGHSVYIETWEGRPLYTPTHGD